MDWMFYLNLLVVLFSIIAVLGTFRYFMNKRIEKIGQQHRLEEEALQTAESNSGL